MAKSIEKETRRGYSLRALVMWTVGVLVVLLLVTAVVTSVVRLLNGKAIHTLQTRWLPAQSAASEFTTAYLNQETGERGFLLSGEQRFLRPYQVGVADATRLEARLRSLLRTDPEGTRLLGAATETGRRWRTAVAEPAITARRSGALTQERLRAYDQAGQRLFDRLRIQLAALSERADDLVGGELRAVNTRQTLANVVVAVALALALLVAALSVPFLRRTIIRPLEVLVARLRTVARGEYEHPIVAGQGPRELQTIAVAAEQMRDSVVRGSAALADAQSQLTLRDERDRIAADLHDHTIQRLFALGLSLSAATSRRPELAPVLVPMIDESDGIIRELRGFIYGIKSIVPAGGLDGALTALVADSARALGFMPETTISADVDKAAGTDVAPEVAAALREALSNVVRHANATRVTVSVVVEDDMLRMHVADNGIGFDVERAPVGDGTTNLRARAERLGGAAEITAAPGTGTVVDWCVPLAPPHSR